VALRLEREKDASILRQAALMLERENRRLVDKVVTLQRELLELKGESPELLQQKLFELEQTLNKAAAELPVSSSERRGASEEERPKKEQKGHGPRPQPQATQTTVVFELDDADKVCTSCGGALEEWEGAAETSEEVHVVSRRWELRTVVQKKYRCRCGGCVETAPGPEKLVPGGRYSPEVALEVAADKYLDHLPLERQVRRIAREGIRVESQTLWDQINALAWRLEPLHKRLLAHVLTKTVVGADETRWRIMGKDGKPEGGSKWWQMWTVCCDDAVYFAIQDSRSAEAARALLGDYTGIVMCDGYTAYEALRRRGASYELAHCWAHARRALLKAEASFPTLTKPALELVTELYRIDAEHDGEALAEARRTKSRERVDRLQQWMIETWALAPPQSALREAIHYIAGLWSGLTRFMGDVRVPLDNNASERALRGPVVGRKNFYGSRSRRGTEVAAIFYSLFESAKLAGLEPKAYVREAMRATLRGETPRLPHEAAAANAGV
jgi:transposase